MAESPTFVIVGAGMAGAKAAATLREEGFEGRIVLLGTEPELPYERPPLSKGYLLGDSPREDARVHPEGFYEEHDIQLEQGTTVASIDPGARAVQLHDERTLEYDRLLITTGAVPKRPPIDGVTLDGVHVLRSIADSDRLKELLAAGGSLAVIGAGWIGCEIAAAARTKGLDVTLLEYASAPLEGVLGPAMGGFFADVHRAEGVNVLTDARVERIEGTGRAEAVTLADGTRIGCDSVLLAVGVAPETSLAEAAGLECDNGILVDDRLRTSAPDVFAAGDTANRPSARYGRRLRVEHWANALEQGPAAARSMLDRGEPFDELPYFFTDQYDFGMEYVGLHSPSDRVVIRGNPEERRLHAFWLAEDGHILAGMHVNEWDSIEPIKQLVGSFATVPPERLADESQPLEELAGASRG